MNRRRQFGSIFRNVEQDDRVRDPLDKDNDNSGQPRTGNFRRRGRNGVGSNKDRGNQRYRQPYHEQSNTSNERLGPSKNRNNHRNEVKLITQDKERSKRSADCSKKFRIGFKILEEWSSKDVHDVIVELTRRNTEFEDLLDSMDLSGDTIILVIRILAKLCSSHFNANKSYIMNLASKDKFIASLQKYVFDIQIQDANDQRFNKFFWQDTNAFFENLFNIFTSLFESTPTRACEVIPKTLKIIILTMEHLIRSEQTRISHNVQNDYAELQKKLILYQAELERKKKQEVDQKVCEAPPDNFRELDVFPSGEELLSGKKAFIRQNIIDGAYDDVDHYLDVQFRLLKEDFVAPLREGIGEFMNCEVASRRRMKFSNVRIHHHVEFISPHFSNEKSGVLLKFDFNKKSTKYNNNKQYYRRFMFGSLVCFTKDDFVTIIFGRVIDRDQKLLENQLIVVELQPGSDKVVFNKPYCMVECSIYFEPYYHVLKALQNIYEDSFPMKKYIIDVNPLLEPPLYCARYALSASSFVPAASNLNLDETQYMAFRSALTQSFSVIQGPPGTGKTYVGLEIAKTLIDNRQFWYRGTPILVVCYTNHALDQFLEGLIGVTKDILRIGGQSKNEKLQKFNIHNQRRTSSRSITQAFYTIKREMQSRLSLIKYWTDMLDIIEKFDSIIDFKNFALVDCDFRRTWFSAVSKEEIIEWLLGGRTNVDRKLEERQQTLIQIMKNYDASNEDANNADTTFEKLLEDEHRQSVQEISEIFLEAELRNEPTCILSREEILTQMQNLHGKILKLVNEDTDVAIYNEKWELEREFIDLQGKFEYLEMRLNEGRHMLYNNQQLRKPAGLNLLEPHKILPEHRWRLYFHWLSLFKTSVVNKLVLLQEQYRISYQRYLELKNIDDINLMREMLVIGMTTTAAARLQTLLNTLKCPIVIVEEAAEVLESHIVVSLTNACEQLILIGDHKQLRPSTATYKLEKDFNLGISLFERMVSNKIQCNVLGIQHRMRPEFAKLIVPSIYPTLQNHESVYSFPPIFGVTSNLYFITHNNQEQEAGDVSKENMHEATFMIALARYFIQNGYQPEDITILAAYSGQMFAMWQLRNQQELLLKDVRITVLDNYQGEESKIILLSLVRSNKENKIGFLKNENRVCVALSRAKEGFYMIGDMDILYGNSAIWPKIKDALVAQQALGTFLTLQCQIHPDVLTRVQSAKDFAKVPEGGCNNVCGIQLDCGHTCTRLCHIPDRVHANTLCKVRCEKYLCDKGHRCPKMCYEECGKCQVLMNQLLTCGHEHSVPCSIDLTEYKCPTLVSCKLPCNHEVNNKPCYKDVTTFKCPFPCDTRVEPCGHACVLKCHMQNDPDHLTYRCFKPCGKTRAECSTGTHICPMTCHEECPPCEILILKKRTGCVHMIQVPCNANVDDTNCTKPCKKLLSCGHLCKKPCFENCDSTDCMEKVLKQIPDCKHDLSTQCSKSPNIKDCRGKCTKKLPCGHPCTKSCREPCTTDCCVLVDHDKPVACGHKFKIPCHMINKELSEYDYDLLKYCKQPCRAELVCKHVCSGSCGECLQGRLHSTCKENCGVPLVCGHECSTPCRQACQPCTKLCDFKCLHSRCKKRCGDPCTKCTEKCSRRCIHQFCSARCGDLCKVQPCKEPCSKKLHCGHDCVGFCGDPCPLLCRICDNDKLGEIFFGTEDEDDARFVLLLECSHIVESEGMEQWLTHSTQDIGYKRCPKCKTILCITQRYSDFIKASRQDVLNIKKKFFGNFQENETKRNKLLDQLKLLSSSVKKEKDLVDMSTVINKLIDVVKPVSKGRFQPINMLLIRTFGEKIRVAEEIIKIFNEAKLRQSNSVSKMLQFIKPLLNHLLPANERITEQEIGDFHRELNRLLCLVQFLQIEEAMVSATDKCSLFNVFDELKHLVVGIHVFQDQHIAAAQERIKLLNKELTLSEKELREIVKAMSVKGITAGHWYKCPNGHYYAIGECGGAMQVGKCNECGADIGGTGHRLLSNNRHAGEMDNSSASAWPPR